MLSQRQPETFAGLALHTDSLRYAEPGQQTGGLREIRREFVPLPSGCIARGAIIRFDLLEEAFRALRKRLRRFHRPVALGIPSGEAVVKFIEDSSIPPEETARSLWSRGNAVLDTVVVDAPRDRAPHKNTGMLAAAANRGCVDSLLGIARHARIPVAALEPVDVASFRTLSSELSQEEDALILGLEPEVHTFILSYRGSSVFFRSILNNLKAGTSLESEMAQQALVEEIRATLTFAGSRFRGMDVHHLILGGSLSSGECLRRALEERTAMKVSPSSPRCVPGFEAAVGLALREREQETACFDLRPAEFVEQERRRHQFSAVRLTSVILVLLFVLSCSGYIALALRELRTLSLRIRQRQEELMVLEARQATLTAEISRLNAREERMKAILEATGQELPVLEVMEALERLAGPEVSLSAVSFTRSGSRDEGEGCIVTVEGESSLPLSALSKRLDEETLFHRVETMNVTQSREGNAAFTLLIATGLQELTPSEEGIGGE